jgi:hypothetical protein
VICPVDYHAGDPNKPVEQDKPDQGKADQHEGEHEKLVAQYRGE